MDTESLQGPVPHASIQVIVAAHTAFNARSFDELATIIHEDVDLFLPISLGLRTSAPGGLRATIDRVLTIAPDLRLEFERAEVVGDLVLVVAAAVATGTDGLRYEWPLRILIAEDEGRITRYVVRAPHADILADRHAFARR